MFGYQLFNMLFNCLNERKNKIVQNERFRTEAFERFELKNIKTKDVKKIER